MKRSTVILCAVFAVLLLGWALFLLGGTLSARISVSKASAADDPDAYASIRNIFSSGTALELFADDIPSDASDIRLEDITITLANRGLVDAEWISVDILPAQGDLMLYAFTGEGGTVPARTMGTLNMKMACRAEGDGRRRYRIEYWIYGMKRTITVAG